MGSGARELRVSTFSAWIACIFPRNNEAKQQIKVPEMVNSYKMDFRVDVKWHCELVMGLFNWMFSLAFSLCDFYKNYTPDTWRNKSHHPLIAEWVLLVLPPDLSTTQHFHLWAFVIFVLNAYAFFAVLFGRARSLSFALWQSEHVLNECFLYEWD